MEIGYIPTVGEYAELIVASFATLQPAADLPSISSQRSLALPQSGCELCDL